MCSSRSPGGSSAMRKLHSSLRELTNVRIREFLREPEAVFWTFAFPILLAIGLGVAFRNKPAEIVHVGVGQTPGADSVLASLRASKLIAVELVPTVDSGLASMRNGKIALVVEVHDPRGAGDFSLFFAPLAPPHPPPSSL